jgi:hypothetical protein
MSQEEDVTLGNLMHLLCEELPEDWEFAVSFRRGEIDMALHDPDGNRVERCQDDMTFNEMVLDYLNHARMSDGLGPVDIKGQSVDPPGPTVEEYRRAMEAVDDRCPECNGTGKGERDPSGAFAADCLVCDGVGVIR